jgi:aspartate/tyrosine/aromatic aminotransferase
MADRITSMRGALVQELKNAGSKHDWSHIEK